MSEQYGVRPAVDKNLSLIPHRIRQYSHWSCSEFFFFFAFLLFRVWGWSALLHGGSAKVIRYASTV